MQRKTVHLFITFLVAIATRVGPVKVNLHHQNAFGPHFNHLVGSRLSPYYLNTPRIASMRASRAKGASQVFRNKNK
jgi:hypothetical protein